MSEPLAIGLVNNMPDAALAAAERQWTAFLSAGERPFRLTLFHVRAIERSAFTAAEMRGRYGEVGRLAAAGLDAVIVTGAEPRADDLRAEAAWPDLARLVDHLAAAGLPSIWSCLAAHLAVLRLDGVRRRPLAEKRFGIFPWRRVGATRALPLPAAGVTPHSRWNDLPTEALAAHGYEILAHSEEAGADCFAKDVGASFLFLQGHPEYEADTLLREYRRDLSRWTRGETARAPRPPRGCLPLPLEARLARLAARAQAADGDAAQLAALSPKAPWKEGAGRLARAWLEAVAAAKVLRGGVARSA